MSTSSNGWSRVLKRDGFVHRRGFFSADQHTELLTQTQQYLAQQVPTLPREHLSYEEDGQTVKSLSYLHEHSAFFDDLRQRPAFVGAVSDYFSDECVFLQMQYFAKAPLVGGPAPWHQDNAYRFLNPPESIIFWVPLDAATLENGCIAYATGSHTAGLLPHVFSGVDGFSQMLKAPPGQHFPEAATEAATGDCLIHLGNTAHRSGGNRSDHPRRALQIVYRSARAVSDSRRMAAYKEKVAQFKARSV